LKREVDYMLRSGESVERVDTKTIWKRNVIYMVLFLARVRRRYSRSCNTGISKLDR